MLFFLPFLIGSAEINHPVVVPQSSLIEVVLPLEEEDEVVVIGRLIQSTEQQLKLQQKLKELMLQFKKLKGAFIQGDQSKKTASAMVHTARHIVEIITDQHLQFHFSKDYLDELTLFASIAGKNGVKRP
ncbi:MAG: hypothetical protein HYZ48_01830 [Chlamydiales bacterium]|nr:hypothetical protein [Chlamydiales bacterium]